MPNTENHETISAEYETSTPAHAGMYATRGWTTQRGINRLILPYLSDRLWGWLEAEEPYAKPFADYEAFEGVGAKPAAQLLDRLPVGNLSDRQNNSPQCVELLELAVNHPTEIELFGYAIGPGRFDERITIEGFIYYEQNPTLNENSDGHPNLWEVITNKLEIRTHLAPPDDLHLTRAHWNPCKVGWWAWWD
ncbi:hypothetical protein HMPREF0044_1398 [Gleimia coleocanis DSM 15436]|uniref:Uncharacterized protein n=1 Tax=Gleimia coleocanis DSM 15436 TaxID=525245 RepID=C0W1V8_9ACTO|nr:hypothetical protein [Gleimia coleocanis]EEH63474.1 hypothetical protein HMPREF0044_1398 [Gleimia coleocanis DSM 15436]